MKRVPIVRSQPAQVKPQPDISQVRTSVEALSAFANNAVQAARSAFIGGVAPLQSAGSGSVDSYLTRLTTDKLGSSIVRSTSHLGLRTSTAGSSITPPRPELDSAEIIESPAGVLDQFSVKLTVSIKEEHRQQITAIKIMRAKQPSPIVSNPSVSALSFSPQIAGKVSIEGNSLAAFRVGEIGTGNKLTTFVREDVGLNYKSVISPDSNEFRAPVPPQNNNKTDTQSGLISLPGADRSVLENLSFYINRRSIGNLETSFSPQIEVGNRVGLNVIKGNVVGVADGNIIQGPNSLNFSEVGRIDTNSPIARTIGEFIETSFLDKTVVYGTRFLYYAVAIGKDGSESSRSRLVDVSVVRTVPPESPKVYYSIVGGYPRFALKCPTGADHIEVFRSGRPAKNPVKLGTEKSIVSRGPSVKVGQFWHLTDVGLGPDSSSTFVDFGAVAGDKLSYRFYTVDSYGFKCQTPFSCSIVVPDSGQQTAVPVPSVTVEQTPGQPFVSVKMQVDNKRTAGFFLQRKEISISEKSAHQANQPEWVDIGKSNAKRAGSRKGPALLDSDWPTYIHAAGGSASFVDTTVRLDRQYQYTVGAVDVRGNKTAFVGSQPVTVYSKVIIDPPVSFAGSVVTDGSRPSGILLTWSGGTNDFSPNAIVGDQDVLFATSVRSVFQVERRQLGRPFWDALPATSESYFFDKVSDEPAPAFRPPYVIPGEEYEYRVMAMQSGGFVSPRTDVIYMSAIPKPTAPEVVWVKTTSINSDPMSLVVSWNMASEFVERWEVERAVTNKIYGEQIPSMDSKAARNLDYSLVASITPEASRARGLSDSFNSFDKSIYPGNRFFVDSDVTRANSYFYRVRTVGLRGAKSEWAYAGLFIKDSAYDRKFFSALSSDDKIFMAQDKRPAFIGTKEPVSVKVPLINSIVRKR